MASTLDGFIAHHDGSFDGWPWDDAYGADLSETFPDTIPAHMRTPANAHAANKWFDLVLMGRKTGGDNLFLLRKRADHFESLLALPCGFVQLTGKYQIKRLEPIVIEYLQEWAELQHREIIRQPFWWGGKGKAGFLRHTMGIRSFLGITEPSFRAFKTVKDMQHMRQEQYFGLWDSEAQSLVLAKDDCLIAYGNSVVHARLLQKVGQWVDLGMPSAASFQLCVYPSSAQVPVGDKQWRLERHESQFLWSLM